MSPMGQIRRRREEFLSAGARRSAGLRRVALRLRLLARLLGLWPTWRRSCLRAGKLGAFFEPCLVILRRIDNQCAFHSIMSKPTQLGADHFIRSSLNRREPDRN